MKFMLLTFLMIIPLCGCHADLIPEPDYHSKISECDVKAEHDLEFGDLSTVGMRKTIQNQIECYKKIAHEVIERDYTKNAHEMKKNMDDYIASTAKITWGINQPDSCYPTCGSIVGLNASSAALNAAKKYLELLLTPPEIH